MTEQHREALGVSLYGLYQASRKVAAMADTYHGANAAVAVTADHQDDAFASVASGPSHISSQTYFETSWTAMRNELLDMFAETQVNLRDTAQALVAAINMYATGDDVVAESLAACTDEQNDEAYHKKYNPDPEADRNLTYLPKVNTSGDGPVVGDPKMKTSDPIDSGDIRW